MGQTDLSYIGPSLGNWKNLPRSMKKTNVFIAFINITSKINIFLIQLAARIDRIITGIDLYFYPFIHLFTYLFINLLSYISLSLIYSFVLFFFFFSPISCFLSHELVVTSMTCLFFNLKNNLTMHAFALQTISFLLLLLKVFSCIQFDGKIKLAHSLNKASSIILSEGIYFCCEFLIYKNQIFISFIYQEDHFYFNWCSFTSDFFS